MSKKLTFRRFVAFIIDALIVSFIVGAFASLKTINPTLDEYNESYNKFTNYAQEVYFNGNHDLLNDKEVMDMSYDVAYYGRYSSVISFVVLLLYFGVFQYWTDGKTMGKLLLRIKVKSTEGKLKIEQTLMRSAIINGLFTKLISIILIFTLSKNSYNSVSVYVDILYIGLILTSCAMIVFREDGVGLHDLFGKTKVVRINE